MNPNLAAILTILVAAGIALGCLYYEKKELGNGLQSRKAKRQVDARGLLAYFKTMAKSTSGKKRIKKRT